MANANSDKDTIGRRKRIEPQSTGKKISPKERDMLWFQKIHEHGPLSSSYLHAFSKQQWTNEKKAKERLTDLFNEDNTAHQGTYLRRPTQQFKTIDARYKELVYDLSTASKRALQEAGLWCDYGREQSGTWWHNYMVSRITASIEIDCLSREDVNYIPGSVILKRADTKLRWPVEFKWSENAQPVTKNLIPDALFGLEYVQNDQKTYRFYVVEADRSTEPATSSNQNRKSFQRHILQYREYVGRGLYKEHLKLTAPIVVLNVSLTEERERLMKETMEQLVGTSGCNYQLFRAVGMVTSQIFNQKWTP